MKTLLQQRAEALMACIDGDLQVVIFDLEQASELLRQAAEMDWDAGRDVRDDQCECRVEPAINPWRPT